tara:strand:- start:158 stop:511 length:354 start_codon:yes stop_codon:yes gene_type:complete
MIRYFSLRMKLNDVIGKNEQLILENVRRCSKLAGKMFKVIFWHENLTDKECENFVKRNEHLLFEVNSQITKRFDTAWFTIVGENDKASSRYKFDGDILKGIVYYVDIIKTINKREEE